MKIELNHILQRNADVSDLEFVSEIGHGSCGHVSKYKYIHTGTLFAVKVSSDL